MGKVIAMTRNWLFFVHSVALVFRTIELFQDFFVVWIIRRVTITMMHDYQISGGVVISCR